MGMVELGKVIEKMMVMERKCQGGKSFQILTILTPAEMEIGKMGVGGVNLGKIGMRMMTEGDEKIIHMMMMRRRVRENVTGREVIGRGKVRRKRKMNEKRSVMMTWMMSTKETKREKTWMRMKTEKTDGK